MTKFRVLEKAKRDADRQAEQAAIPMGVVQDPSGACETKRLDKALAFINAHPEQTLAYRVYPS
jgi:hypothetical protein